jgi:hypothetical protein
MGKHDFPTQNLKKNVYVIFSVTTSGNSGAQRAPTPLGLKNSRPNAVWPRQNFENIKII